MISLYFSQEKQSKNYTMGGKKKYDLDRCTKVVDPPRSEVADPPVDPTDASPQRAGRLRVVEDAVLSLNKIIQRYEEKETPALVITDPLLEVINRHLPVKITACTDGKYTFADMTILKEPLAWFLVFGDHDEEDLEKHDLPGVLTQVWRHHCLLAWITPRDTANDRVLVEHKVTKLQAHFMMLGRMFYLHPAGRGPAHLISITREVIMEAAELIKELEGHRLKLIGLKQATEFYRLFRLKQHPLSPCVAAILPRLSFRGDDGKDKNTDDEEPDGKRRR